MKQTTKPKLSLVIPVFNEEQVLPLLFKKLNGLRNKLPKQTEVIFVDDGSEDKTLETLKILKLDYPKTVIEFSRNFGHQAALMAGLREAKGEFVVSLDGDLQHPPETIVEMLELHKQGYEVVLTNRVDGQVTDWSKRLTARIFYRLMNLLSQTKLEPNSSDFRSLSRNALDSLLSLPEHRKFLRGMVQWIGFKTIILPFTVERRGAGTSKYSAYKMMRLALHGLTSFSAMPLFLAGIFSLLLFLAAGAYAAYVLYKIGRAHV